MKKFVCLLFCLCVIVATLAGCGTPHKHAYSVLWSVSETQHWHQAICEHDDERRDVEQHTFVEGKCTVCGYEQGAPVPPEQGSSPVITPPTPSEDFGDDHTAQNDDFYEDYTPQEKQLYYTLWQETTVVKVEIDISARELQKLNEAFFDWEQGNAAKADVYRKCNLTITVNGTPYRFEEVGIRMRGNTSRSDFVNDKGQIYNLVHFRFSLTETFDGDDYEGNAWASELYHNWNRSTSEGEAARKQRKGRSFATMEKFYYKWNKCYDQTYIREVYANRMFLANGVLAPHITLSQICVKQGGEMASIGVGNLYELIDKQFIKRNFDKQTKGGDLYKCTYTAKGPADLTHIDNGNCGIETATEGFSYDLKTNDDPEDFNNHKYLKQFVQLLQGDGDSQSFIQQLSSHMDMDYFARFEAVNYLLGNPDCIRNNANNYYLYFTPQDADGNFKAYIIPYDYDRCLGVNVDWNPKHSNVYIGPYDTEGSVGRCNNPLYTKTFLNSRRPFRADYTRALNMVLSGEWFRYDNYQKLYNAYAANYSALAQPSKVIAEQCAGKVNIASFVFSEGGTSDPDSGANMSVSEYMRQKRTTATDGLDD